MENRSMCVIPELLMERIDANRGDLSRSEWINLCIDTLLGVGESKEEVEVMRHADENQYITRDELGEELRQVTEAIVAKEASEALKPALEKIEEKEERIIKQGLEELRAEVEAMKRTAEEAEPKDEYVTKQGLEELRVEIEETKSVAAGIESMVEYVTKDELREALRSAIGELRALMTPAVKTEEREEYATRQGLEELKTEIKMLNRTSEKAEPKTDYVTRDELREELRNAIGELRALMTPAEKIEKRDGYEGYASQQELEKLKAEIIEALSHAPGEAELKIEYVTRDGLREEIQSAIKELSVLKTEEEKENIIKQGLEGLRVEIEEMKGTAEEAEEREKYATRQGLEELRAEIETLGHAAEETAEPKAVYVTKDGLREEIRVAIEELDGLKSKDKEEHVIKQDLASLRAEIKTLSYAAEEAKPKAEYVTRDELKDDLLNTIEELGVLKTTHEDMSEYVTREAFEEFKASIIQINKLLIDFFGAYQPVVQEGTVSTEQQELLRQQMERLLAIQ